VIRIDNAKNEGPMTLPKACEWLGEQTGRTPATSTMWRWVLRGVRGGIRLESFRVGGTTYTTREMVQRFIDRTSQSTATVNVSPAGVIVNGDPTAADDDHRREQIAVAQERLAEICAPKRRPRARASS
jgi:hypothetical protein